MISKKEFLPTYEEYKEGNPTPLPYQFNGASVHDYLQEMNREVLSKYDIMTVGECPKCSSIYSAVEVQQLCQCGSPLLAKYRLDEV